MGEIHLDRNEIEKEDRCIKNALVKCKNKYKIIIFAALVCSSCSAKMDRGEGKK